MTSDFLDRVNKLSPKRLALLALELHEQLEAATQRPPIAVIGMGCRFPGGADDPAAFWQLLSEGRDAIREVPAERWDIDAYFDADPDTPARMSVRHGGFLDRIDGFDAEFFGIAPREALTMDPQQRLALEVAWEALEHAGVAPERLAGSATGVFLGICNSDHFQRVLDRGSELIDAYLASGNAHSVTSGRIAYFLGLQGPALSIDTACSSSLVALHVACQSLRSGETRLALAGGVNMMCAPQTTIALTKAHMLAPDGRCKTFSAAADGFARGEGCGMLVLKRLDHARADGDRVLAVIRGTAANQDGRSGGLTVPNGPAQEAVIRAALADARLAPADIGYVEAHGTGTTLGDPIEVRALAGALGPGRAADAPLIIGSVKTNIGHLESAAGIAGVIKVVLSLQHGHLPPHLHFDQPSPHIAWADYPVRVEPAGRPWPQGDVVRRAGVSSFGFSGTNAHVIVEEAAAPAAVAVPAAPTAPGEPPLHVLPLSARSPQALRQQAQRLADALAPGSGLALADAAHTLGVGRSHFSERLAVVAEDEAGARDLLLAFVRGEARPGLHTGTARPGQPPEVVFMFTGQGSQYPGMAARLYATAPVFRAAIDRCDALLGADSQGRTLKSVLQDAPAEGAAIHETVWTQPALFAVEWALTELWRSWGITPAAVIGHSVGEYVAACVAGVFTLEAGLGLIAERGRLMQALPPGGAMAAVFAPADDVARAVARQADRLAIAAFNAPDNVVVSGEAAAVDALLAEFAQRGVQGQRLFVSLAAHSPLVDPALAAMEACAGSVDMRAPRIPVAWNATGGAALPKAAPDATYWRRHLREPVRFAQGLESLYREGHRVFLEVGPHPTLTALAQQSLPERGPVLLASLRRGKDDWREVSDGLAQMYVQGAAVEWAKVDASPARRRVALPTYPFERRSFWIDPVAPGAPRMPAPPPARGLPGSRLPTAVPVFETLLSPSGTSYLNDHRVLGAVLVPAPVFLELAQAAAAEAAGPGLRAVEAFEIHAPLVLADAGRSVQTHVGSEAAGRLAFSIHSRPADGMGEWRLHASGRLVPSTSTQAASGADTTSFTATRDALGAPASCEGYYAQLAGLGIELGPALRSLRQAHRRDGEALAEVRLPTACGADAVTWAHPALLDGALQAVGLAVPASADAEHAYLFTGVERIELVGPLPAVLWCHARVIHARDHGRDPAEWHADVTLRSPDGGVLGVLRGVRLRRAPLDALRRAVGDTAGSDLFYQVAWESAPPAVRAAPCLQPTPSFVPQLRQRFRALAQQHGLSIYEELLPELDRLSADHVATALRALGFDDTAGRAFDAAGEARRLGVIGRHARLFARLLEMLLEDKVLRARGDRFEVVHALSRADAGTRYDALLRRFAATDGELSTLRRCGHALARVLRGEQDPLQLLFPGGSFTEARKLYVDSPFAQTYNRALGEALQAALAGLPAGARLRVLEIGAGTGGTTTYVLPLLPAGRTEYTFTDLSPLFLERAAEQFAAWPFVRHALLDIEREPLAQGFEAGRYDIVIAANVLHATADLKQALQHVRSLMAPGAMLFLLEGVAPERWVDLTFGLTEGWWRFSDAALRPHYPLIPGAAWLDLLHGLGFEGAAGLPEPAGAPRGAAQQALIVARAPAVRWHWTLVGASQGVAAALARRLEARGAAVTLLPADAPPRPLGVQDQLVYLAALEMTARPADDASARARAEAICGELPQRWLAAAARGEGRIRFVTQGAQAAGGAVHASAPWQALLWGWGRGFALEHPGPWAGIVDLPIGDDAEALADTLLTAIDAEDGEDQTAWRGGNRLAARLTNAARPASDAVHFKADACYLVTGGFGGLGLLTARWMAARGARHIALLGRRADACADGVRAIEAQGAKVHALQGDVADEACMARLLAQLRTDAPPLRGVMHAAAALSAMPLAELSAAQIAEMLRPKVAGTLVLERLTRGEGLDFLVLFSSTTALLGASGLAHYAAANTFLDGFAQALNPSRRVLSVNWGTWDAMRLASAHSQRSYRESGLQPMAAPDALDALGRLLAGTQAQAVVAKVDWAVLKPLHEARRARPFLSLLGAVPPPVQQASRADAGPDLAERLAAVPVAMRHDLLVEFVQHEAAAVLGLGSGAAVPIATGLFDLGMDSLMAVELKRRLERGAGRAMPSTLTFNYPNVAALAGFLEAQLIVKAASASASASASSSARPAADRAAAVVPEAAAELDQLSDDELEARLLARLEAAR